MTGKEVLRAIADGADPSAFEIYAEVSMLWLPLASVHTLGFILGPTKFRRKPRTQVVNGFTVPAPIQEMPERGDFLWWINLGYKDWCFGAAFARDCESDQQYYLRGLLFTTKEAAIANAKAMCGIDPEQHDEL